MGVSVPLRCALLVSTLGGLIFVLGEVGDYPQEEYPQYKGENIAHSATRSCVVLGVLLERTPLGA